MKASRRSEESSEAIKTWNNLIQISLNTFDVIKSQRNICNFTSFRWARYRCNHGSVRNQLRYEINKQFVRENLLPVCRIINQKEGKTMNHQTWTETLLLEFFHVNLLTCFSSFEMWSSTVPKLSTLKEIFSTTIFRQIFYTKKKKACNF